MDIKIEVRSADFSEQNPDNVILSDNCAQLDLSALGDSLCAITKKMAIQRASHLGIDDWREIAKEIISEYMDACGY